MLLKANILDPTGRGMVLVKENQTFASMDP